MKIRILIPLVTAIISGCATTGTGSRLHSGGSSDANCPPDPGQRGYIVRDLTTSWGVRTYLRENGSTCRVGGRQ